MPTVEIRDDVIWLNHISDKSLAKLLCDLKEGDEVTAIVAGKKTVWAKMRDGRDGRPTPGIKPLGTSKNYWSTLQNRRGEKVPFDVKSIDSVETADLTALTGLLQEWADVEDEAAFSDL